MERAACFFFFSYFLLCAADRVLWCARILRSDGVYCELGWLRPLCVLLTAKFEGGEYLHQTTKPGQKRALGET